MNAASVALGYSSKKHQDWFDENNAEIRKLLQAKHEAHAAILRNPKSVELQSKWKQIRAQLQKELRHMENSWWRQKAQELQSYADTNDVHKFYQAAKAAYGPSKITIHPVRSKDGSKLIKDHDGFWSAGQNISKSF